MTQSSDRDVGSAIWGPERTHDRATASTVAHHVLVVDADEHDRWRAIRALERHGFAVTGVASVEDAQDGIARDEMDLLVVDPATDDEGLELVARLTGHGRPPLVVVSARCSEGDRVLTLTLGADDHVSKPFSPYELAARVSAVLRRSQVRELHPESLTYDEITIDRAARQLRVRGVRVHLTPKEYDLLVALASRPGWACSADELLEWVWGCPADPHGRATLIEHVRRLRKKVGEDASCSTHLVTVRGVGYRWDP